jgi:hypothetical protein
MHSFINKNCIQPLNEIQLHVPIDRYMYTFNVQRITEGVMVFNATFDNISVILWQSILMVEEPLMRVRIPLRQGVLDTTLCDKVCQ